MAAPQIPNLLLSRVGASGRVRGQGRDTNHDKFQADETTEQTKAREDRVVQLTDQDANLSRLSAVDTGYLVDPFA